MAKIDIIGKYNKDQDKWSIDKDRTRTSLAIASYDPIIYDETKKIDYIIYCYGSRVENHSKDGSEISEKKAYVDKILNYFKSKKHNIIVKFVMLDKDSPLKNDGVELAEYINDLGALENCKSINIVGYSKSGVMFFDMIKYIDKRYYDKINLYNVATPYSGTKMASPKVLYNDVKIMVENHIPNKKMANMVYCGLIKFYESISSNSHMDYDISIPNGIPDNKLDNYDETLIKNLLLDENINAIKSINSFQNYLTCIDDTTLKRAMLTGNYIGIGMCLINDLIMNKNSDGFVPISSEKIISDYIDVDQIKINGAHHYFMSDSIYRDMLLYNIDKRITEDDEKKIIIKHS